MGIFDRFKRKKQRQQMIDSLFSDPQLLDNAVAGMRMGGMSQDQIKQALHYFAADGSAPEDSMRAAVQQTRQANINMVDDLLEFALSSNVLDASIFELLSDYAMHTAAIFTLFVPLQDLPSFSQRTASVLNSWFADCTGKGISSHDVLSKARMLSSFGSFPAPVLKNEDYAQVLKDIQCVPQFVSALNIQAQNDPSMDGIAKLVFELNTIILHGLCNHCEQCRPISAMAYKAVYDLLTFSTFYTPKQYQSDAYSYYLPIAKSSAEDRGRLEMTIIVDS
ncbi:MAG: hypothetical protein IKI64_07810 [Clostridia bacterium]|nr:hypothetical protein [Clostridia bacterium]